MPKMDLMPDKVAKTVPAMKEQEKAADPIAYVKFFCPWNNWTWYVTEYDPAEEMCFGLVQGFEEEWGYFHLQELREVTGPGGLGIERDLYFDPTPISKLKGKR